MVWWLVNLNWSGSKRNFKVTNTSSVRAKNTLCTDWRTRVFGLFMASSLLQPAASWGGKLWNLNLEADKLRHTSPGCHPPRINISKCWAQNGPNFSTPLSAVIQNKLAGSPMAGWQTQGASDFLLHVERAQAFLAARLKPKCVLCSQQPVSGPYPESDESNPQHHTLYFLIFILMVTGSIFTQVFQVVPFCSVPHTCSYSKLTQSVVQYCKKVLTFKRDALIPYIAGRKAAN